MLTATTTTALATFGTVFSNGLDAILPAMVAVIQPIWVPLVTVSIILAVVGGLIALMPKRVKMGKRIKV